MDAKLSKESYEMVRKLAIKFSYGSTSSILFDQYLSVGVEALIKAVETYKNGCGILFSTYLYRCVMNSMVNEKIRMEVHKIEMDDNACENLENYDGKFDTIKDTELVKNAKAVIMKAVSNNERSAKIVELHIGLEGDPMELKDIASLFECSHEWVRRVCVGAFKKIKEDDASREILFGYVG